MKFKILFIILLIIVAMFSVFIGSADINFQNLSQTDKSILINLRIPRVIFSILIGAMLGLSGAIYQLVLKNPLADSFTTGAASSSALGAVVAIALGFPVQFVSVSALATGLSGLLIVYFLSSDKGIVNPVTMILAGVVLNIVASSIIGFTKYYFEESLSSIVYWLMGGFHIISPIKILFVAIIFLGVYLLFILKSDKLNLLALDDYSAQTSGINVKKERIIAFVFSTLLVAVSVSFTGLIGFVGLIVPHVARSFFGSDMKNNIFYSSVFGGILLLLSDTLSRVIIPGGAELPVGIITAILGGIFFLYILSVKKSQVWHA